MTKYICYGCGRAGRVGVEHLGLCWTCKLYKTITKHNPNKLGYEDCIKELQAERENDNI